MQPVDIGCPLRGRMPQERGAVVLQIWRQFYAQCPLMAQSGHTLLHCKCLLMTRKRT